MGEIYEAVREAADKFALYRAVKEEGGSVIEVREIAERRLFPKISLAGGFGRISTQERIMLARNLGSMLEAGLALSRALSVLERQTRKNKLRHILESLNESVKGGKPLSEGLANFPAVFSDLFVAMVRSGEESGKLAQSLKHISDQMQQMYLIKKKIRGAMIYPTIILGVIIVIGIAMFIFVIPTITQVFKDLNAVLPLGTRVIIALSDFLSSNTLLFLGILALFFAASFFAIRLKPVHKVLQFLLLRLPIISVVVREINSARTARTLASLITAGVPILTALSITAEVVENYAFRAVIREAQRSVEIGQPISKIFLKHADLYPSFVGEMITVGEETGKLGEMFTNIAVFYEAEVDQKMKNLSQVIEPLLMIVIGVVVALFSVAIIQPMYSLVNFI